MFFLVRDAKSLDAATNKKAQTTGGLGEDTSVASRYEADRWIPSFPNHGELCDGGHREERAFPPVPCAPRVW
jgi:hypothetical protein